MSLSLRARRSLIVGTVLSVLFPRFRVSAAERELVDLEIEELVDLSVSTASKYSESARRAPSAVTIVTRAQIQAAGHRTLAEILDDVRGLFTTKDDAYTYLSARGFGIPGDYNSRILLLVNGHQVNDSVYDSALIGEEGVIDVDLIDRVEVVRGPGSALYGGNALFAVVNILTRASPTGTEVSLTGGSFGTGSVRTTTRLSLSENSSLLLSATGRYSHGPDLQLPTSDSTEETIVLGGANRDMGASAFVHLTVGHFSLQGLIAGRSKQLPFGSYETIVDDPRTHTVDVRSFVEAKYELTLDPFDLSARAYYDDYRYHGQWASLPSYDTTLNTDHAASRAHGVEVRAVGRFGAHQLVLGVEGRYYPALAQSNSDVDGPTYFEDSRDGGGFGGFGQASLALFEYLRLVGGLRYDYLSVSEGSFSPRAALVFTPGDTTSVKLMYGRGFRPPNAYEKYYEAPSYGYKRSEALASEKIDTFELVAEATPWPWLDLSLGGFHWQVRNLIQLAVDDSDGLTTFQNQSTAIGHGLEAEATVHYKDYRAVWSHSFQVSLEDGVELPNAPRHISKLELLAPLFPSGLQAHVEFSFLSARATLAGAKEPPRLLTDVNLTYALPGGDADLALGVVNLFNTHSFDPGPDGALDHLPREPREIRFRATVRGL